MATRLTHIVDENTSPDALRQLSLLLFRSPGDPTSHQVVAVGVWPRDLTVPTGVARARMSPRLTGRLAPSSEWSRVLGSHRPRLIHAWGTSAAAVARGARPPGVPLAVTVTDPVELEDVRRWWPLEADFGSGRAGTVVCASEFLRRRAVGTGIPRDAVVTIRPGVEHRAPAAGSTRLQRADLDLPEQGPVLLTGSPPTRGGGQFFAVWAAAILFQVWPGVRLVIPGRSREQDRIRRLIETIYCPQIYRLTEESRTPAELLGLADVLVAPLVADGPTGWLALAMTARVPIVGSELPSVTELIRDRETGFLCRPGEPHRLAIRIRSALESPDAVDRCTAAAGRLADEYFAPDRSAAAYQSVHATLAGTLAESSRPG